MALPKLTLEEVELIIKHISGRYEKHIDWDSFCCASDAADGTARIIFNVFREAYGKKIHWRDDYDEEDDE